MPEMGTSSCGNPLSWNQLKPELSCWKNTLQTSTELLRFYFKRRLKIAENHLNEPIFEAFAFSVCSGCSFSCDDMDLLLAPPKIILHSTTWTKIHLVDYVMLCRDKILTSLTDTHPQKIPGVKHKLKKAQPKELEAFIRFSRRNLNHWMTDTELSIKLGTWTVAWTLFKAYPKIEL